MCFRVTRSILCEPAAPRIARSWADSRLAEMYGSLGDAGEDAVLVVSELITNCLNADAHVFSLTLVGHRGAVRIEATDDAAGWPGMMALTRVDQEHGRGLQIVDALSVAWGVRVEPVGKTVWAELATPRHAHLRFRCARPPGEPADQAASPPAEVSRRDTVQVDEATRHGVDQTVVRRAVIDPLAGLS